MADTAAEAAAVTAFWQELGLPGLVDVHTHFMPDNVLVKVWDFVESGRAAVGQPWPIVYRPGVMCTPEGWHDCFR